MVDAVGGYSVTTYRLTNRIGVQNRSGKSIESGGVKSFLARSLWFKTETEVVVALC